MRRAHYLTLLLVIATVTVVAMLVEAAPVPLTCTVSDPDQPVLNRWRNEANAAIAALPSPLPSPAPTPYTLNGAASEVLHQELLHLAFQYQTTDVEATRPRIDAAKLLLTRCGAFTPTQIANSCATSPATAQSALICACQ